MDILLILSRLLLTAVFAVAGAAKLADLPGSRRAVREFGLPASWANIVGLGLPLTELVLALALVPVMTAWWAALGMLILLLSFIVGISINLARGRTPDCHCFGTLSSAPIGWSTLVRNSILAVLAGFIVWQGPNHVGPSAVHWLSALRVAEIIGLIAIVVILGLLAAEAWFLFNLLRQNGRLLLRIEAIEKEVSTGGASLAPSPQTQTVGLPFGTAAPDFHLPGLYGETLTLASLRSTSKPLMLIFSDPGCSPCNALLPEIALWQRNCQN